MASANFTLAKEKRRLPQTRPQKPTSVVASGSRKSLRQQKKSPVSLSPQSRLTKASSSPLTPISQLASTKRKRSKDSEAEAEADEPGQDRPIKQPRINTPPSLKPSKEKPPNYFKARARAHGPEGASEQPQEPPLLAEEESQSLQSVYENVMNRGSNKSLKRTSSRDSIAQSRTGSDQTQRSAISHTTYRRLVLTAVNIEFHVEPPGNVEATIKNIINPKFPRAELDEIAKTFRKSCLKNVKAQSGEDDFIDPLHTAIKALGFENICIHEKAAWRPELKPMIQQQQLFSSSFITYIQQPETNDASAPLPKSQQQHSTEYISPESSMIDATTPLVSNSQETSAKPPVRISEKTEKEDRSPVKTPHPDLSVGIDREALISALSQDRSKKTARIFFDWLQTETVQLGPGKPSEPILITIPAQRALDLAFPFLIIEGKAYSTGKQIFEAENQAAVSAACAHNILHRLDSIANREATMNTQPRVLFSITTQGPIHELWAHWTVVEDGVRMFESTLWDSWSGLVQSRAYDFIVTLHSVCDWGTGPFMESVVEGLKKVATQAGTLSSG